MEILIGVAIILFLIWLFSDNSKKQNLEKQQQKARFLKEKEQVENQKKLEVEKEKRRKEQQEAQKILIEEKRLEAEILRKLEEEKYEFFKIVVVGQRENKYTCVLERENKTYAYVERENTAFQLDSNLKLLKETVNKFDWFSQSEHIKKQEQIKIEFQRQKEVERQRELQAVENIQRNFCETNTSFCNHIENLLNKNNVSFTTIRRLSVNFVNQLTKEVADKLHSELNSGVTILETEDHLHQYIHAYGNMHQAKLNQSFEALPNLLAEINGQDIQIIDYGCGQGIGSIVFIDFLKSAQANNFTISKIRLIEPSEKALKRASLNLKYCLKSLNQTENVLAIHKTIDQIVTQDLITEQAAIKFHIFSNILDVDNFNITLLAQKINNSQSGINYFICVSPKFWEEGNHPRNLRLDTFAKYFQEKRNVSILSARETNINNWRRYERTFKGSW